MKKKCITIDRQYGSGGREIGKILAKRLNMPYYDKELLFVAAEQYGLNPGILQDRDEKRTNGLLYNMAVLTGDMRNVDQMTVPYEIFQAECETIQRLAEETPCVFIGRCANFALTDICEFINVFIYASDMEARIKRAKEEDGVDCKNVENYVRKKDTQRKGYHNFFAEKEWGKIENYDLCLNSSALGYRGCADAIIAVLESCELGRL